MASYGMRVSTSNYTQFHTSQPKLPYLKRQDNFLCRGQLIKDQVLPPTLFLKKNTHTTYELQIICILSNH